MSKIKNKKSQRITTTISVDRDVHEALCLIAAENGGMSFAALNRKVLNEYLERVNNGKK